MGVSITNTLPVVSQVKSFVQAVCGDTEGARETQVQFSKTCPSVSQVRSLVEACCNDPKAAENTQKEFGHAMGHFVESVPVIGHTVSLGHLIAGQKEESERVFHSATRTTLAVTAGVTSAILVGPGAAAIGFGTAAAYDATVSAAKRKPFGMVGAAARVARGESNSGEIFDLCVAPAIAVVGTGIEIAGMTGAAEGAGMNAGGVATSSVAIENAGSNICPLREHMPLLNEGLGVEGNGQEDVHTMEQKAPEEKDPAKTAAIKLAQKMITPHFDKAGAHQHTRGS